MKKNPAKNARTKKHKIVSREITWKVDLDEASGQWIGTCDPVGLTASGDTYNELVKAINESVDAVLQDLLKSGDLDKFL